MKKLLPTLLPLLSTALIAIVPQLQHFLIAFVAAHPGWSSFATAAALILNHWLPSPGAVPADSTIAKAGTSLMLCFALITVPFTTGCNYSQADVIKAVQNTESVFKTAQTFLPQAQVIANELQQTDPEAAEYVNDLVGIAGPALQKLITASDNYLAVPGDSTYQAILNLADAFVAQIDQDALKFAGIKNPQSQQKATAWIVIFSTGLHVGLGVLEHYATKGQINSMPKVAHASFDQIRPFLNRSYAHDELAQMGYSNPDQLLAYAGL
jgi:hypothetical protein